MPEIKEHQISGYERVVEGVDKDAGLHCFIAVHNTALGPALGGTRMYPYRNTDAALTDVLRLAEGMTYKSSVAEIGLGGGKSVIIGDPKTQKSEALLKAFAEVVNSFGGNYICAEDMGTTTEDMAIIREQTQYVVGLKSVGSSGNPAPFTAWGVFQGLRAVSRELFGTDSLRGRKVAIQGLGAVGARLAEHLFWEGAELVVSDVDPAQTELLAFRYGAEAVAPDEILKQKCDILAPCAIGGIINPATIPYLQCKAVAGAANNQLLSSDDGIALKEAGILYAPDFVINSGGIINVSFELEKEGYQAQKAKNKVDSIYKALISIFWHAKEENLPTYEAAHEIAKRNVEEGISRREAAVCFHS